MKKNTHTNSTTTSSGTPREKQIPSSMIKAKITFLTLTLGLLFTVAGSITVSADIAPEPMKGSGAALKSGDCPVEMIWEVVDLRPTTKKNNVTVTFAFKNTSKKAASFEVGFPSYFKVGLQDFKVDIDGKNQNTKRKKEEADRRKSVWKYWMCWNMKFAAGEQKIVKVSYSVDYEADYWHSGAIDENKGKFNATEVPKSIRNSIMTMESGYVLRTGAGWKGNIGRAEINLHYSDSLQKDQVIKIGPDKGWKYNAEKDIHTLVLENFEPTSEDDVRFRIRSLSLKAKATLINKALEKGQPMGIDVKQYLVNLIERKDNPLKLKQGEKEAYLMATLKRIVGQDMNVAMDTQEKDLYHSNLEFVKKTHWRLINLSKQANDESVTLWAIKRYKLLLTSLHKHIDTNKEKSAKATYGNDKFWIKKSVEAFRKYCNDLEKEIKKVDAVS